MMPATEFVAFSRVEYGTVLKQASVSVDFAHPAAPTTVL